MPYYYSRAIDVLNQIEQAERTILASIGCPTDPAGVFAILAGEQPAPWPKKTAARDAHRANTAMFALRFAQEARATLDPLDEDASRAVYWALQAGAWAGDVVRDAALGTQRRESSRKGGRKRGAQQTEQATEHDPMVRRYSRLFDNSDDAKDEYRSRAAFIEARSGLPRHTIKRALKRLAAKQTRRKPGQQLS